MKNYFSECADLEAAKKIYRKLAFKLHPDQGGSKEAFQNLQNQYEAFLNNTWTNAFNAYAEEKGYAPKANADVFKEILKEAVKLANDKYLVQIIGYWIYVFNGFTIKEDLKSLGFWWSKKHKAWIYSGMSKIKITTRLTLDQIKDHYGCETIVDEKEEIKKIQ